MSKKDNYQHLALMAVQMAWKNPETWCGDADHDEQVVFANDIYTVASNGDASDYSDPGQAVTALATQWRNEGTRG